MRLDPKIGERWCWNACGHITIVEIEKLENQTFDTIKTIGKALYSTTSWNTIGVSNIWRFGKGYDPDWKILRGQEAPEEN